MLLFIDRPIHVDDSRFYKNLIRIRHIYEKIHDPFLSRERQTWPGAPLFNLFLEAYVPADVQIATIKNEVESLAAELNLDLNFIK